MYDDELLKDIVRKIAEIEAEVDAIVKPEVVAAGGVHTILDATLHSDTLLHAVAVGDIITGQTGPVWNFLGHPGAADYLLTTSVPAGVNTVNWSTVAFPTAPGARGSILRSNAVPAWVEYAHPGAANRVLQSDATDAVWSAQTLVLTTSLTNQGANGVLNWGGAFTLTIPATGTAVLGTGAANRVAYWSGVNNVTSDAGLQVSAANDMYIVADAGGIGNSAATARLMFDSSGGTNYAYLMSCNVGVGTATPGELLHLYSTTSGDPVLLIENWNADAVSSELQFYKNSTGPADNDDLGRVTFYGEDSVSAKTQYAYILSESLDVTAGDTAGSLQFIVQMDAVARNLFEIKGYNGVVNQGEIIFNEAGQDVDIRAEAVGVADAFEVRGSDGQITLGALTAGIVMSDAGGVLSVTAGTPVLDGGGAAGEVAYWSNATTITSEAAFAYNSGTNTLTVGAIDVSSGGDVDPADASGQDLGDATHRWDLYTQEVYFGGATGANFIQVPDNLANALYVDDAGGIEYLRITSTDAQPVVDWNNGEADVDFRIRANAGITDPTDAFFLQGSTGFVGVGTDAPGNAHLNVYDATLTSAATFYGISSYHTKTAGAGASADDYYGIYSYMELNQSTTIDNMWGAFGAGVLSAGTLDVIRGVEGIAQVDGGTSNSEITGARGFADVNAGTVNDVVGVSARVDIEAAATVGNAIYGVYVYVDDDDNSVTSYMVYLDEKSNIDYGFYQSGSADNYLGGYTGVGTTPSYSLHVSEQDANATSNLDVLAIQHTYSGTGVGADFGVGMLYRLEDNGGNFRDAGATRVVWEDASATENAEFQLWLNYNGNLEQCGIVVGPDYGSVDGNQRGVGAVDWQTYRSAATQVASGDYAVCPGGKGVTAAGDYSFAMGAHAEALEEGEFAQAAGRFAADGDAQHRVFVVRNAMQMAINTPYSLYIDGAANLPTIPTDAGWAGTATIIGMTEALGGGVDQAIITGIFGAENDSGAAAIQWKSFTVHDDDISGITVDATIVGTSLAIQVEETDGDNPWVRWVGIVGVAEVRYP